MTEKTQTPPMLGTVIIIDDDDDTLATLNTLVTMEGLFCETYSSATAYQAALARDERLVMRQEAVLPRCIFCDVNMPGLTGLEFQEQVADQHIPLVLMSGDANVKDVIRGFRAGIHDFLVKPIGIEAFLILMHKMLAQHQQQLSTQTAVQHSCDQLARLTAREREVAQHLAAGKSNLHIAQTLSISPRTIKFHRKNIYEKLNIISIADLVRIHQHLESTES